MIKNKVVRTCIYNSCKFHTLYRNYSNYCSIDINSTVSQFNMQYIYWSYFLTEENGLEKFISLSCTGSQQW